MVELARAASPFGSSVDEVLARLHASDVIRLGASGLIDVAYPFSALPTRHRVRLGDGGEAYSMGAVDALGIAFMFETDTVIETSDPVSGNLITVIVEGSTTDADATRPAIVKSDATNFLVWECPV
jgi:hypothetical protein